MVDGYVLHVTITIVWLYQGAWKEGLEDEEKKRLRKSLALQTIIKRASDILK